MEAPEWPHVQERPSTIVLPSLASSGLVKDVLRWLPFQLVQDSSMVMKTFKAFVWILCWEHQWHYSPESSSCLDRFDQNRSR